MKLRTLKNVLSSFAIFFVIALIFYRALPDIVSGKENNRDVVKLNSVVEQSLPSVRERSSQERNFRVLLPQPAISKKKAVRVSENNKSEKQRMDDSFTASKDYDVGSGNNTFLTKQISNSGSRSLPLQDNKGNTGQPLVQASVKRNKMTIVNLEDFTVRRGATEKEGRVLLRKLEHGLGPLIEIAWPVTESQRHILYQLFRDCYGMEVAVINKEGELFRLNEMAGKPWLPNLDRYSSFIRKPAGSLTAEEHARLVQIKKTHAQFNAVSHVRLFSRRMDAMLLGGLKYLIGDKYQNDSVIRAHYKTEGGMVIVENILLDGKAVQGLINLPRVETRCKTGAL